MKKQLYRAAAATVLGLSLTTGIVAADNSANITGTGADSDNTVQSYTNSDSKVKNDNKLGVDNMNNQKAWTGDASANKNTDGGTGAMTGDAGNGNKTGVDATVNNSASTTTGMTSAAMPTGSGDVTIGDTGADSHNSVESKQTSNMSVTNTNTVQVKNTNNQTAASGDATVSKNTDGGSATTGAALNTNESTFSFNVTN